MRPFGTVLLLLSLFVPVHALANADIFVNFGDIKGECGDTCENASVVLRNTTGMPGSAVLTGVPFLDSEVLVSFATGDPRQPFIIGTLWDGVDVPPASSQTGDLTTDTCATLPCQLASVQFTAHLKTKLILLSNGDLFLPDSNLVTGGLGDLLVHGEEITAAPEPASLLLIAAGVIALNSRGRLQPTGK